MMNEKAIFEQIEAAVIVCVANNDVAMPMATIKAALETIAEKLVNGEYDRHENL